MTILTTLVNDPVPPVVLLETSPITPPLPGTQLVTTLQWNNLLDLLRGTSVDEIDRTALEVMTFNRAAISDGTGHLDVSVTTLAELALLTGLTENVQTSLNAKELSANKGAVSGYAALDAAQLLLLTNFPAGTGLQVLQRNAGNTALEFATPATPTLEALTDTTITAAAANEVLVRNAGNTAWVNELLDNANFATGVFANITGLGVQSQALDMGAQAINNAENITMNAANTDKILTFDRGTVTPATGTIGDIIWQDQDSIPSLQEFARIRVSSLDVTSGSEDATMTFRLVAGGSIQNYMLFNSSSSNEIAILKNMNFFNQDIIDIGQIGFQTGESIVAGGTFLDLNVAANDFIAFRVAGNAPVIIGGANPALLMTEATLQETQGADVPSLGALVLGTDGNYFNITGTTNIATISSAAVQNGTIMKLKFDGVLTITHGTGANQVNFADGVNYTTAVGDVISIIRDAAVWVEVSRSRVAAGSSGDVVGPASATDQAIALFDSTTGKLIKNSDLVYDFATTKQLTMPGPIILSAAGTVPAGTNTYLREDGSDLDINVTALGNIFLQYGGTQNYDFDQDRADFMGNNLINAILTSASTLNGTTVSAGLAYNNGIKQTFNPSGANAGLNVGADAADASAPVNGDIIYNSTSNKFRAYENGAWADMLGAGGGEFFGPMTALHDYAGFNIGFKTASPITLGQGATNLLSVTILDDVLDAGFEVKNTDGFVSITNDSAVAGEFYGNFTMKSGGATNVSHNIMTFQVPSTVDTGETPYLTMNFEDSLGGSAGRPLMEITAGATTFVTIDHTTEWFFHTATSFVDLNDIEFTGKLNTDLSPGGFTSAKMQLPENTAITWDGAAAGTPNFIGFSGSDAFQIVNNSGAVYTFNSTLFDLANRDITSVKEYKFQSGGASEMHGVAAGVVINSPTLTSFEIGGAEKFTMDASFINMGNLHLRHLNSIRGDVAGTPIILKFEEVASAINYISITNSITAVAPEFSVLGTDADIDFNLTAKGLGNVVMTTDATAAKKFLMAKAADVAAPTSLVVGDGNILDITGTGTINHIQDSTWQDGSVITLQFDAAATVAHNTATPPATTSAIMLEGAINFVAAAGDTLTLYYDSADDKWIELARKARTNTLAFTMLDAQDISFNTSTGTKIGTATTEKLAFFNSTPIVQPTAITTVLTTLTSAGPGTPDYAIQAATSTTPFGFVTADEMETVLTVIINNQARIADLESKLQALGLLA